MTTRYKKEHPDTIKLLRGVSLIAFALLLIAATGEMPYLFYILLRWYILIACIIRILHCNYAGHSGWQALFVIIGLFFNPLIPVTMSVSAWRIFDIAAALVFFPISFGVIYETRIRESSTSTNELPGSEKNGDISATNRHTVDPETRSNEITRAQAEEWLGSAFGSAGSQWREYAKRALPTDRYYKCPIKDNHGRYRGQSLFIERDGYIYESIDNGILIS